MRQSTVLLVLAVLLGSSAHAQAPVTYTDVGIIINQRDTNSVAIGNYFVQKRNIPVRNVILVDVSPAETITDSVFQILRGQIESYLTATGLKDSLNYLVTTKGVPLRVNRGGTGGDLNSPSASVDAELMLILGQWASHIGQATLVIPPNQFRVHPYFGRNETYSRRKSIPGAGTPYDMYLVTRLIGLTKEDVLRLIDNSGPFRLVNKDSALFVLDRDPQPIDATYNNHLTSAASILTSRGWRVLMNNDSVYVTDQRNVLGYASWGSNDHYDHLYTQFARPRNTWLPGSVAETFVSTSARNFIPGQTSGQSRIADLIEEGCTGSSGYVYEPFSLALTWVHYLLDRYTRGYNLAESFYMANPTMSWMAIVVGDPKTSIITEIPPVPSPRIEAPSLACAGDVVTFTARNALPGNMFWFAGDSMAVKAAGPPYDEHHPLWTARDSIVARLLNTPGRVTLTFVNENFIGTGFAQSTVDVLPQLNPGFILSADTVYLSEQATVTFTDTTVGSTSWQWNFGDGQQASGAATQQHTYTMSGVFSVRLIVSNGACSKSVSLPVVVLPARPTSVEPLAPAAFALGRNHPNPFSVSTIIPFELHERKQIQLALYTIDGRFVKTIFEAALPAGRYAIPFDASDVPAGSYVCRLEGGGLQQSSILTISR